MDRETLLATLAARGIRPTKDADIVAIEVTARTLRQFSDRVAQYLETAAEAKT
ncbi:hypothetical protein [Maliponia aquimaris]|uniref:Uncharacterized protein n=1 Tax=Maliponia aquimaris TaxID=1673631 RepID=A0A238KUC7_9RHOB|nr:hypothetical protein [Maliponia aquimaris]SMX46250.1 hypothetical protein MAA8898_03379 [Maliponia aquimaris]